ncbi:MAG: hypothetical protein CM15mP1_3960 [Methanobacteriota archaeon]|nr:MAG: hypothetical protein CM15mP1_3960 [Euryarchaeota archaeon]
MVRRRYLQESMRSSVPREPYQFYIDTAHMGSPYHGGFGLGVDRVCSLVIWGRPHQRSDSISQGTLEELLHDLLLDCIKNI